jgi:hypothetical protein
MPSSDEIQARITKVLMHALGVDEDDIKPHVDLAALKRDRRLNRIDDLFTVELLSSFIMWKLGARTEPDYNVQVAAADPIQAGLMPGGNAHSWSSTHENIWSERHDESERP